jgi:predicted kinase
VDRAAFARAFAGASDLIWIECRAPAAVIRARAQTRVKQPAVSDAGSSVAVQQVTEWEALEAPAHLVVRTDTDAAAVAARVRDGLDARLRGELRSESVG